MKKIKRIFYRGLNMWMFVFIKIDFVDDVCINTDVRASFDGKWALVVMNNSFKMSFLNYFMSLKEIENIP